MTVPHHATILAADVMRGDILIHFSDGASVLFRALYLSNSRGEDENYLVPIDMIEPNELHPLAQI